VSLIVLRDPTLSDESKERQLREASLHLFKLLAYILLGTGAALGAPLTAVWGLQLLGFGSVAGTLAVLTRVDFIVAASLVATFAYLVGHRVQSR
jgi:membrane protein DedA with SNARE-associated domain